MTNPRTEKELSEIEKWAQETAALLLGRPEEAGVEEDVLNLIADLRASRAALVAWLKAQDHRRDCEGCEGPEPCPEYDDLASRAVLLRDAALPWEAP